MTTSSGGSVGMHFEGCTDVTVKNSKVVGWDTGIRVINSTNFKSHNNLIVSKGIFEAIDRCDPKALLMALGLPPDVPTNIVAEAISKVATTYPNIEAAKTELKSTRLVEYLGAGADILSIAQAFYSVIPPGAVSAVLSVLNR